MTYEIGFIGLGKMGSSMVRNLLAKKYHVVGHDKNIAIAKSLAKEGMYWASSLEGLTKNLTKPRTIWLMVPSKSVEESLDELTPLLDKGDTIIDGGNSYFRDSQARYGKLKKFGLHFLDCGTSGGIEGARQGACLMVGGDKSSFEKTKHIFRDLSAKNGYAYLGKAGAGHFAKMIHNAIEYSMMGAIAEGMNAINGLGQEFGMDGKKVASVYCQGSIIQGKLMDWLLSGMHKKYFNSIPGTVPKGETEEEMENLERLAKMPLLKESIQMRQASRIRPSFEGKIIAVLRNEFGGHALQAKKK